MDILPCLTEIDLVASTYRAATVVFVSTDALVETLAVIWIGIEIVHVV